MPTQKDLQTDLETLHGLLKQAWQHATNQLTEDRILDLDDDVRDMITHLNQENISSDNAAFTALGHSLSNAQKELKQLEDDIDSLIADVALANSIASAIDTALNDAVSLGLLAV